MPNMLETVKDVIEQFQKVQRHMLIAKKKMQQKYMKA